MWMFNIKGSSIKQVSVDVVCFVQFSEEEEDIFFSYYSRIARLLQKFYFTNYKAVQHLPIVYINAISFLNIFAFSSILHFDRLFL